MEVEGNNKKRMRLREDHKHVARAQARGEKFGKSQLQSIYSPSICLSQVTQYTTNFKLT